MHFDLRLWRMTGGLRGRIALGILLGLLALAVGIARFAFLGQFLARLFRAAPTAELVLPLVAALAAILLRAWLEHARTMVAHRTAARVQETLRAPALRQDRRARARRWFGAERTGGVMLSMIDGVEQLQTFFGQYLPQVSIAACAPLVIFAFMAFLDLPVARVMLAPRCSRWSRRRCCTSRTGARVARAAAAHSRRSARSSSTRCRACRR